MSTATAIESRILWVLLRRRLAIAEDGGILSTAGRTLIASLVMAAVAAGWQMLAKDLPSLIVMLGGVGLGAGIFGILALLLKIEEARIVPRMILAKVRR